MSIDFTRARYCLVLIFGLFVSGCGDAGDQQNSAARDAEALRVIDDVTRSILQHDPQIATRYTLPDDYMGGPYGHRLRDYSPDGHAAMTRAIADGLTRMEALSRDQLGDDALTTLDVALAQWRYILHGGGLVTADYVYGPYLTNHMSGPYFDVPNYLVGQHRISSPLDARDYVLRVEALADTIDGSILTMQAQAQDGVIPPKFILKRTISVIDEFVSAEPELHTLFTNLEDKLEGFANLTQEERVDLLARVSVALEDSAYPAYQRLKDAVAALVPLAGDHAGMWAQPGGDAMYDALVRTQGDTDLTAEEIHQIGLDEVARISAEADVILRDLGYIDGSPGERLAAMVSDPRFLFADTDQGRAELMTSLKTALKKIESRLPEAFGTLPTQKLVIKRVPLYAEATSASAYYEDPAPDGSRPGTFYVALADMAIWPRYDLPVLAHHEGIPGHHMQISLAMESKNMPVIRTIAFFNAYVEGWALYAEKVADELGVYDDDPVGRLGMLRSELYRAARLVVDTGMHRMHWSREKAINYFHASTGTHMTDTVVEIERYVVWPGQALGYKLGQMKFMELCERARTALGERFDIREFHDFVLLSGAMPLMLLDARVDAWIAEQVVS